jgi:hypothetical protein
MAKAPPDGWEGILETGEDILWQGAPEGGVDFTGVWSVQTLFALFFTAFSLFWITMAYTITGQMNDGVGRVINTVFPLFGLPFLLVGLHLLVGRFWADARRRRNSYYTLTNRAAYIGVQTGGKRSLDRYAIGPDTRLTLEDGDLGSIWFASRVNVRPRHAPSMHRSRSRIGGATQTTESIGFERLCNAREIYAMMRKVQTDLANAEGSKDA